MQQTSVSVLSPWLTMWYSPRRTIRRIVDTDPRQLVFAIFALAGSASILSGLTGNSWGELLGLPVALLAAVVGGPLLALLYIYVVSPLLQGVSRILGGQVSLDGVRAVFAWSLVPNIWAVVPWFLGAVLFGSEFFAARRPPVSSDVVHLTVFVGFWTLRTVLALWSIGLLIAALSEIARFSIWRAIAAWLLWLLIIVVFAFLIAFIIMAVLR